MRYLLAALLLLAACTPVTDTATQPTDTGPTPRDDLPEPETPTAQPADTPRENNATNQQPVAANDTGYEQWRTQQANAVTLLVSDGETAARTYLEEGEGVQLALGPGITIEVGAVDDEKAQIIIDNRSAIIQEDSEAYNADRSVIVYVTETIVT